MQALPIIPQVWTTVSHSNKNNFYKDKTRRHAKRRSPYFHPACCESTRVIDPRALLVISFTLDNRLVDAIALLSRALVSHDCLVTSTVQSTCWHTRSTTYDLIF
jgi:hypothetical protein